MEEQGTESVRMPILGMVRGNHCFSILENRTALGRHALLSQIQWLYYCKKFVVPT